MKIHGGGAELERLRTLVAGASAVTIGGVLNESSYVLALRTASACLVTQKPGLGANFLPSKLLPALAAGCPILAICDASSPLGAEVLAGGFGEVLPPGDVERLREVLDRWTAEPALLVEMSRRSSERAALYHRERILKLYEQELRALAGEKMEKEALVETEALGVNG